MTRSPRTAHGLDLEAAIRAVAWRQIAELGAPALSLRGIARELGITAPAIYNYFPRRDDLVTALIIEAYTSFGDSQIAARDSLPPDDLLGRLDAIGVAYRAWAITHPQRYQLIFEASIPGYDAPKMQIMPTGAHAMSALLSVVEALRQAGRLRVTAFPRVSSEHEATLALWKRYGGEVADLTIGLSVYIWSCVHGLVSLEIAGNLPPFGPNGDELYRYGLASLAQQLFTEAP
ncbi:MAG: TetR/AcrR family transcriptional regulator [Chloroflexales bacterium]|nr:TetR/AcrR family transcriptional regulator [Chloroflexales bacterium]